jgi:hypothetical protein
MKPFLAAALIVALAPAALAADSASGGWDLTTFPNAALLAQHASRPGGIILIRSISCLGGDPHISVRVYHQEREARPAGSRKGCDTRCRTEMVLTDSDGRRPAGFSESQGSWTDLRTEITQAAPPLAEAFAKACRLPLQKTRPPLRSPAP